MSISTIIVLFLGKKKKKKGKGVDCPLVPVTDPQVKCSGAYCLFHMAPFRRSLQPIITQSYLSSQRSSNS